MQLAKVFLVVLMAIGFVACGDDDKTSSASGNKYEGIWVSEATTFDGIDLWAGDIVYKISAAGDVDVFSCENNDEYRQFSDVYLLTGDHITGEGVDNEAVLALVNNQLVITGVFDPSNKFTFNKVSQVPATCNSRASLKVISFSPSVIKANELQTFSVTVQYRTALKDSLFEVSYYRGLSEEGYWKYWRIAETQIAINSDNQWTQLTLEFDFNPEFLEGVEPKFTLEIRSKSDEDGYFYRWVDVDYAVTFDRTGVASVVNSENNVLVKKSSFMPLLKIMH